MCSLHYVAWSPSISHFNDQVYRDVDGSTNPRCEVRLYVKKAKIKEEQIREKMERKHTVHLRA